MATYRTTYPGNTALQEEVWDIPLAEAKAAIALLQPTRGSYWENVLLKPYRRATRAKAATVRVYTAHFSTSELSNVLYNVDATVTRTVDTPPKPVTLYTCHCGVLGFEPTCPVCD